MVFTSIHVKRKMWKGLVIKPIETVSQISAASLFFTEWYRKVTFDFTESVINKELKWEKVCQIVRFSPILSKFTHAILKIFLQYDLL